jgi:spore coat protein SA
LILQRSFPQTVGRGPLWPLNKRLLSGVIRQGLRDLGPDDIVWVHNRPDSAAAIASYVRRRRAHLVLHMHNSHIVGYSPTVLRELSPSRTVFCSSFLEAEALAHCPTLGPTAPIPNGADDKLFFPQAEGEKPKSRDPLTVLFVGRLVPEKGAHVLIEAMRILLQRQSRVRARIIGSSSFSSDQATEYEKSLHHDAPENVEFLGFVGPQDLGRHFREADVFCCPSTWNEPFGMVNVEAMASGLPVIATRCGGIPEVFFEGGALLVEANSPGEIADACQRLEKDPALYEQLAREGLASFRKNFTWSAVHRHYRNIAEAFWD